MIACGSSVLICGVEVEVVADGPVLALAAQATGEGAESMMRQLVTMRHPIAFILFGALVAVLVLYPIRVVDVADVATSVEGENFDVKPTGTKVVTDTALYSNGQALKFSNNTAIAKETGTFSSEGDGRCADGPCFTESQKCTRR